MIPFTFSPPSAAASLPLKPSFLPSLKPIINNHHRRKYLNQRRLRNGTCRAEFSADAPIGIAIGGCILSSLLFPIKSAPEEEDGAQSSVIDTDDARYAVMAIISFIPYFNWLTWVFAWMDTGRRRYVVYAIVYLAPYLRSNLSLSPEDSWLPIASILLCIAHIQLEISIKNDDIQGVQIFSEIGKHLSSIAGKIDDSISKKETAKDHKNLPSSREQSRNEIRGWRSRDIEKLNGDEVSDEDRRQ